MSSISFNGSSSFAPDLQTALNRAIAIASLPIKQLSAQKQKIDDQSTELNTISGLFNTLQKALDGLASGSGSKLLSANVSDSSVIKANLTGSALQGTYAIEVLDPGSASSALSNAGSPPVTDPSTEGISASASYTLTVGSNTFTLTPDTKSLNSLASAINASGAGVQATIINLGSPSAPDYRLALQSTSLGDVALQLNDGASDLLNSTNTGATASYTVNGQPPGGITSDSSTVTIAPGLNVTLEKAGTSTVTVAGDTSELSKALSSFVDAYNAVVGELQKNHGKSAGALTGDSSILYMETSLRQLVNYSASSISITSLTQLGIQFTQQGTLTFNSSALSGLSSQQIADSISFLGDPNSGGYLKSASDTLKSVLDPITGLIPSEQQTIQKQSDRQSSAISDAQDRVNTLANNLMAQMAAADALIASLEQQTKFITGIFQFDNKKS